MPLWERLGLNKQVPMLFLWAPQEIIDKIWEGSKLGLYNTEPMLGIKYEHIHSFITSRYVVESMMPQLLAQLHFHGSVWFSLPSDTEKMPTDLTRKDIRELCVRNGLLEKKTVRLDDQWSSIQFKRDPTSRPAFKETRDVLRFGL